MNISRHENRIEMTIVIWLSLLWLLMSLTACVSNSEIVRIELISHSGEFEFASETGSTIRTGHAWYRSSNPLCTQLRASFHGQSFLSVGPRHQAVNIEFDTQTLYVPKSYPSRAWCNYELGDLIAIMSINGTSSGSIYINAKDDGPTEINIYCHRPSPVDLDFLCRGENDVPDSSIEVQLNLSSDTIKIHAHLEG